MPLLEPWVRPCLGEGEGDAGADGDVGCAPAQHPDPARRDPPTRSERADAGDEQAAAVVRVLTPLAKLTITKRARTVAGEAMEVRGGNGYIADWPEHRLLRDAHLGSIWEGTSTMMALDVLRTLRRQETWPALDALVETNLSTVDDTEVGALAESVRDSWRRLRATADKVLAADADEAERRASVVAWRLADHVTASALVAQAAHAVRAGLGHRVALLTAMHTERVLGRVDPVEWAGVDASRLAAILDGDDIPATAVREVLDRWT